MINFIKKKSSLYSIRKNVKNELKIYIHVGSPKTGSSAIQRLCLDNRLKLQDLGYYYPEHPVDRNSVSGGHMDIARALRSKEYSRAQGIINHWFDTARKKNLNLLLSSEAFYNLPSEFSHIIFPVEVKFIGFIRSPLEFLIANYNQAVKRHNEKRKFSVVIANALKDGMLSRFLNPLLIWKKHYGPESCSFRNYLPATNNSHGVLNIFLHEIDLCEDYHSRLINEQSVTNKSYAFSALTLKRLINIVGDNISSGAMAEIDLLLQEFSDSHEHECSLGLSNLPPEIYSTIYDKNISEIEDIVNHFPNIDMNKLFPTMSDTPPMAEMSANILTPLNFIRSKSYACISEIKAGAIKSYKAGDISYSVLKLLDSLNIPFDEPRFLGHLDSRAIDLILSDKYEEADRLRTLALYFEKHEYYSDAFILIKKAQLLRPNGQAINIIYKRLSDVLRINGELPV